MIYYCFNNEVSVRKPQNVKVLFCLFSFPLKMLWTILLARKHVRTEQERRLVGQNQPFWSTHSQTVQNAFTNSLKQIRHWNNHWWKDSWVTLSKDCWIRSLNSSCDFQRSEKFTIGLNSEKYIKCSIEHRRNSIAGDVNSASSPEESLCMQLNDTHTLNSFSNGEHHSKKSP